MHHIIRRADDGGDSALLRFISLLSIALRCPASAMTRLTTVPILLILVVELKGFSSVFLNGHSLTMTKAPRD